LLTGADDDPLPPRFRLARRPRVGPSERHLAFATDTGPLAWRPPPLQVAHRGVARHVQEVAFLTPTQLRTELGRPTEVVVAGDPAVGQAGQAPVQQVQGDLPFLLELDLPRDVTFRAAVVVVGPVLGQVEPPVQRG